MIEGQDTSQKSIRHSHVREAMHTTTPIGDDIKPISLPVEIRLARNFSLSCYIQTYINAHSPGRYLQAKKDQMEVKYDKIGTDYNSARKADPFLTNKLIEHLSPRKDGNYLDIGCGTGNYTNELEKNGLRLIGIDPSEKMLQKARLKNSNVDWRMGTVENIELSDNSADGVIGSLTIHHWTGLQKGFSELHRVLKPDGRIVIFTSTPKQMEGYWLNHYFPKMLKDSIDQMPSLEKVEEVMTRSNIAITKIDKYFIQPDLQDKFLYCGKQNPELYFDKQIRNGISSFSSLANRTEVNQGLTNLKRDIDSGKINEIIESYDNDLGDYLCIVGNKASR